MALASTELKQGLPGIHRTKAGSCQLEAASWQLQLRGSFLWRSKKGLEGKPRDEAILRGANEEMSVRRVARDADCVNRGQSAEDERELRFGER